MCSVRNGFKINKLIRDTERPRQIINIYFRMTSYQFIGEQQFYGKLIRFFFNLAVRNKRISIKSMGTGMRMKQRMAELMSTDERLEKRIGMIIYPYCFDAKQITEISQILPELFI